MKLLPRKPGIFVKLLMGYVILLVIMIFPYVLAIRSLDGLSGYASSVADTSVELIKDIAGLRNLVPDLGISARQWVNFEDPDSLRMLVGKSSDFMKLLAQLKGRLLSMSDDRRGGECVKLVESIEKQTGIMSYFAIVSADSDFNSLLLAKEKAASAMNEFIITDMIDKMVTSLRNLEHGIQELEASHLSDISTISDRTMRITLLLLICAVAFTLVAPFLLYRYLKRPIDRLMVGTEVIGRGEFDRRIPVDGDDELSELARAFNVMASRLRELDALKSDFISVMGHELRTPLAAMVEAAKLLSEPDIGELNDRQAKLVNVLNSSMKRLSSFIDQILELSRLKAGLEAIEKKPHDLAKTVEEVMETVEPIAREKQVKVEFERKNGSFNVLIDEDRLFRAIMNILHNAIKFSPAGGDVKVTLEHVKFQGNWCRIGVVDGGPGISAEDEGRIFDKFYQIQTVRKKGGAGLGLAIAREIITAHGGRIWVESPPPKEIAVKEGSGAVFWFTIPC